MHGIFEKLLLTRGKEMKKVPRLGMWLFLLLASGIMEPGVHESTAGDRPSGNAETSQVGRAVSPVPLQLNLRDFVKLVRDKNEQIGIQASELTISREAVKGARAIFEPAFVGSYQYMSNAHRNTIQELVSESLTPEFHERSGSYQAAVEGMVPTGANLRVGYTQRDFTNNLQDQFDLEKESQTAFGLSLTQPLLKGAGIKPTMAGIRIAEKEADIALQTFRGQMMRVIGDAIRAYWDLSLAREKYRIRKESELNAGAILKDNIIRVKAGKMAETEVLEANAALAMRQALVSEARQAIIVAVNVVRTFFSSSAMDTKANIEPTESLQQEEAHHDFAESLARAFKFRTDYLASKQKMEREDIRLVFAENQTWPKLDLKGSYNMNGLADAPRNSLEDAFRRDFETWSVSVELRIPLEGDKKSRSELEATRQRKRQALLEMKAVEVSLVNAVDTAIEGVSNALEQVSHASSAVDMNKQLLEAERVKYMTGKSSSRTLLEREEDLNKAKEVAIESQVKYKYSLVQLGLAEGSLLMRYDIELTVAGI